MQCVFCGGKTEKRTVTFSYEDDGKYIFVENVPADVCTKCGERTYSCDVTDMLLKFAKQEYKPVKKVMVPVFDYSQKKRGTVPSTP
ncbi:hypothetical protein SY88_11715 [Clostridiales bacterium PH28_bin88]|nr:hypothetical protein SY88_11715 [Clostridiales bacterium PH28_bin88]